MLEATPSAPCGGSQLLPLAPVGPGERLYGEFLAGRSPNTLQAYAQDLAAFTTSQGAGSAGQALEALIGLRAGEGNSRLLAWRAAMLEAGLAPATINRRLSAVRSALRFARTIGATTWVPEISGLKATVLPRHSRSWACWHARAAWRRPRRSRQPKRRGTSPSSG